MALYIHIPFCEKKCDYCDFYSLPVKKYGRLLDSFAERLCDDIDGQLKMFGITEVMSVYIGGGTPSLLGARRIKELLDFLAVRLKGFPPPAEFTVEANPESLDADFLRACREGGVTRISCGIQAFDEASRR
ncbi:MAG: radical SAM protein, partial [Spirochaetaceae bacterium]|nr:radical SAM protein [Spirochaetaceae bacterium]